MAEILNNEEVEEEIIENSMEEDEDDGIANEVDFSDAVVWGTDWTTETIARQIAKGNIDLNPSFQRRDAWSAKEKSKLIESLMLGIPVPPIVLAEDPNMRNHYYVIDGKQRLLSIMQFYTDCKSVKAELDEKEYESLSLNGLEILKDLNKKTYSEVPEKYLSNIDNGTIRTIAIKNWPSEDFLYTVFLRLNTGSKKLSPQELRQALKPGKFLNYLDTTSAESAQIKRMLNIKKADKRMRDVELALRYFGFKYFIQDYKGNLREFLDMTCETLNGKWDAESSSLTESFKELENAIDFSYSIFPKHPFGRYKQGESSKSFNRCIYELFTFYFSRGDIRERVNAHKEDFIKRFINLNDKPEFNISLEQYPKQTSKVVSRFNQFADLLISLDEEPIEDLQKFKCNGSSVEVI